RADGPKISVILFKILQESRIHPRHPVFLMMRLELFSLHLGYIAVVSIGDFIAPFLMHVYVLGIVHKQGIYQHIIILFEYFSIEHFFFNKRQGADNLLFITFREKERISYI